MSSDVTRTPPPSPPPYESGPHGLVADAMPIGDEPTKAAMRARLSAALFGVTEDLPTVGRFRVVGRIGSGGMGVVYEAHDDELDRKVAIKVLHEDVVGRGARRLRQEARALARLSHPNVIQVFEVGTWNDRLFLAMELVRGCTLDQWCRQHPDDWRTLLELFLQAGRALAAAHAAGIVHRDFKPSNVIVGDDGRVRVLDFGLALAVDAPPVLQPGEANQHKATPGAGLTRTGTTVGTPGYMSPEQLRGGEIGPASDQFSFCVSMYEALFGERPFEGDTEPDYVEAVLHARRRLVASAATTTGTLLPVIERGLEADPRQRHPSMLALLAALERPRRRRFPTALLVTGTLLVCVAVWWRSRTQDAPEACQLDLPAVWDATKAEALAAAILDVGFAEPEDTTRRLNDALAQRGRDWTETAREACSRVDAATTASDRARALDSVACLEISRIELDTLVALLLDLDREALEHSPQMLAALRPAALCLTAPPRLVRSASPEEVQVDLALRSQLSRARFARLSGRYDEATRILNALDDDPRAQDDAHTAERLLERGRIAERSGDGHDAVARLEDAAALAVRSGRDEIAADAWLELANVETTLLRRPPRARASVRQATAYVDRLPEDLARRAARDAAEGQLLSLEGDHAAAAGKLREALATTERALGAWHPDVAEIAINTGNEESELGQSKRALALYQRAFEIRTRAFGPNHVLLAPIQHNLAIIYGEQGRSTDAEREYRSALRLLETAGEAHALQRGRTQVGLALLLHGTGRAGEALAVIEPAEHTLLQLLGPTHDDRVKALSVEANVHDTLGQHAEALACYQTLRSIHENLGAEIEWAKVAINIPGKLMDLERWDEASRELETTIPLLEKALGQEHPWLAIPYQARARLALRRGETVAARSSLERARSLHDGEPGLALLHARIAWDLAKMLPRAEHERARNLANEALTFLHTQDSNVEDPSADEITAWLAPTERR